MTDDLVTLQAQGKCEQVCPSCGLKEAAGFYCTRCGTTTYARHWRRTLRSDAQREASRATGRSTGKRAALPEKTADPEVLA